MTKLEQTLRSWIKNNPFVFRHQIEGHNCTLVESGSGKMVTFTLPEVKQFRIAPNSQGLGEYMNLVFENHAELVLCHVGFAFSPDFSNTGPIEDAPPVCCMQDYYRLRSTLGGMMRDEAQKKETIMMFQVLISILDGAKKVGLNIHEEEDDLEKQLTEFETTFK